MKQIRNNVFETNSSSTHVLCLNKNMLKEKHILGMNFTKEEKYPDNLWDNYLLKLSDEFANMYFDVDWYDYPSRIQSPYQKLRYVYTYCACEGKHWIEAFADVLSRMEKTYKIQISIVDEDIDKLKYVNERDDYLSENDYVINHQSSDLLEVYVDKVMKNEKWFKPSIASILFDIITKPKYMIFDIGSEDYADDWFNKNNLEELSV